MAATGSQSTPKSHSGTDVWNAIDNLKTDVPGIKGDMSAIGVKLDNVTDILGQVVRQTNESKKTPWSIIFGGMAVVISLGTATAGAVLAPLYLSDGYMGTQLKRHIESGGHPETKVLITSVDKDIERIDGDVQELKNGQTDNDKKSKERHDLAVQKTADLDTSLQREMRDLDTQQKIRLDGLDTTLQREIQMLLATSDARWLALETQLEAMIKNKERLESRILTMEGDRYTGSMARGDLESEKESSRKLGERIAAIEAVLNMAKNLDSNALQIPSQRD
jgi:hypothetical protein